MTTSFCLTMLMLMPLSGGGLFATGEAGSPPKPNILVVYFSHSGNTRMMAEMIKEETGADIFEIVPVSAYPKEYRVLTEQARKEIHAGFKPQIKTGDGSIERYDVVYVGSPNWWSTIAPPVATFLSEHPMEGKTLIPFMTHGGGGMGHSERDIRALCPRATVLKGLPVQGDEVEHAREEIVKWLKTHM